ncbi:unnamed protein product [Haemonchus placei]|uniref:RNase H domain-containing protein n=1 Tax=Haemonchus placei TaxID=6290 RepID=A0A0N4WNS6_HAEPC|nr:unnamed protein product [Haemonchus placei]
MARQRLAPTKNKSIAIPRLELLALLIGTRLIKFILKEIKLKISTINIYSDSQVALHSIQSNSNNGIFVNNRCKEIRESLQSWKGNINQTHLYYIPSEQNPADCATRGLTKEQMSHQIWWSGPTFLRQQDKSWPEFQEFTWHTHTDTQQNEQPTVLTISSNIPSGSCLFITKFSSLKTLRQVTALILKFIKHALYDKLTIDSKTRLSSHLPELDHISSNYPLTSLQVSDIESTEALLTRINNATNFKYSNEILSMEDTDTVRVNTTIQTFLTNE